MRSNYRLQTEIWVQNTACRQKYEVKLQIADRNMRSDYRLQTEIWGQITDCRQKYEVRLQLADRNMRSDYSLQTEIWGQITDCRQKYEVKLKIAHYIDIAIKVRSQIVEIEVGQISNNTQMYMDNSLIGFPFPISNLVLLWK